MLCLALCTVCSVGIAVPCPCAFPVTLADQRILWYFRNDQSRCRSNEVKTMSTLTWPQDVYSCSLRHPSPSISQQCSTSEFEVHGWAVNSHRWTSDRDQHLLSSIKCVLPFTHMVVFTLLIQYKLVNLTIMTTTGICVPNVLNFKDISALNISLRYVSCH